VLLQLRADVRRRHLRHCALVDKRFTGTIAGLVGAGGNLGGVCCGIIFKNMATPQQSYRIIALMVAVSVWFCNVQASVLHHIFTKSSVEFPKAAADGGGAKESSSDYD
jgi:nitrate/nitrite transporter NarK